MADRQTAGPTPYRGGVSRLYPERLFHGYRKLGDLSGAANMLYESRSLDRFLATNLCIGLSFLAYNTFEEINRHFGDGEIIKFLFSPRTKHTN